jgi:hypothetical protein
MGRRGVVQAVALLGAVLGLAGCYPVKQTYFTPSAPTGVTMPNECHHQIGPRGSIIFKLDRVVLSVIMDPKLSSLTLVVEGIKHNEISFGPEPFVITSRQGAQTIIPQNISESWNTAGRLEDLKHINQYRILQLQYKDGVHMRSGRGYDFTFKGLPMGEEQFTFSMPALMTGTSRIEVPPITFTKITEWRIDPAGGNC